MTERVDHFADARNLAVDMLRRKQIRTPELLDATAANAVAALKLFDPEIEIDHERLVGELRHLFSVGVDFATALDDLTSHEPWLDSKLGTIEWRFWNRYRTYLERDFGMPPMVVDELDRATRMVLERLEDPQRTAPWDRRGMVVGSVQSGKTANYNGLICKAIDAGYKLVIVLAGTHSNLRAQTQLRLDEGVLGFDTQKSRKLNADSHWVGVGKLPGERLVVHSLTSSAENGDFNKAVAENIGVMLGGDPVILVVKKNSRLLGNLLKWILHVGSANGRDGSRHAVRNVPLLVIDDEADNASINTKARPGDDSSDTVTAINGKIRQLLDTFDKSVYVGYTATPFANIFINPDAEATDVGEDLFPRSFIINVKPPSNYIGPERVFGLDGDPDAGILPSDGLPIVQLIDDYAEAFPPNHKSDLVPEELPGSLKDALRYFIVTCAARRARGQVTVHNSMLIHVTRFVRVQEHVVALIQRELSSLQRRIEFGDGERRPRLADELEELWADKFVGVTALLGAEAGTPVTWDAVKVQLRAASAKIVVLPINGFAKEALDYKEHELDGRSVIAVGGDKLARGLTLEGLSTSYFLRTSRMYDTLMQMGRWFGYRPGYVDLCRLFTTRKLREWYRHIALAETELRREFDYMVNAGLTPENYGLRVRTHPQGMIVTAINKMSHGRTLELSWAGTLVQTSQLQKTEAGNVAALESLIGKLPALRSRASRKTHVWADVPYGVVAGFVSELMFPPASARASGKQLATFIRKQAEKADPELTRWTIALVSKETSNPGLQRELAGYELGLIERTPEDQTTATIAMRKSNILNPGDEGLDFESGMSGENVFTTEWLAAISGKRALASELDWLQTQIGMPADEVALALTRRWQEIDPPKIRRSATGVSKLPNGRVLRTLRRATDGLLLIYPIVRPVAFPSDGQRQISIPTHLDPTGPPMIGVALSFPVSDTAVGAEYRVTSVWGAEIAEDDAYAD